MKPMGVGVLGPGRIFHRVMKDLGAAAHVELVAVASRNLERAHEEAERYGARHAFGSYEQLAACEDVELIYISTPHPFHCEQAIMCMEAGKHVLCEKPMAINDEQVARMIDCARRNNVFLMEAMWSRFFPAMQKLQDLLKQKAIGEVWHMTANFSSSSEYDATSRLFDPRLAGGALLDIGVYCVMAATMVLGSNLTRIQSGAVVHPSKVDLQESIQLSYPTGATAQLFSGLLAPAESRMMIYGSEGRIEMPEFWHPTRFTLTMNGQQPKLYEFEPENEGFRHEFDHVAECIRAGLKESPVVPWDESLAVSKLMTQMRKEWGVIYPQEEQ